MTNQISQRALAIVAAREEKKIRELDSLWDRFKGMKPLPLELKLIFEKVPELRYRVARFALNESSITKGILYLFLDGDAWLEIGLNSSDEKLKRLLEDTYVAVIKMDIRDQDIIANIVMESQTAETRINACKHLVKFADDEKIFGLLEKFAKYDKDSMISDRLFEICGKELVRRKKYLVEILGKSKSSSNLSYSIVKIFHEEKDGYKNFPSWMHSCQCFTENEKLASLVDDIAFAWFDADEELEPDEIMEAVQYWHNLVERAWHRLSLNDDFARLEGEQLEEFIIACRISKPEISFFAAKWLLKKKRVDLGALMTIIERVPEYRSEAFARLHNRSLSAEGAYQLFYYVDDPEQQEFLWQVILKEGDHIITGLMFDEITGHMEREQLKFPMKYQDLAAEEYLKMLQAGKVRIRDLIDMAASSTCHRIEAIEILRQNIESYEFFVSDFERMIKFVPELKELAEKEILKHKNSLLDRILTA